jgi:UDP-4-amino-4-deoxy-L-arabinose formyltransferase/UDP-glucuronic acid dehydrogenase (UDP-4-keto-hexauronic acid decarboxylating)
VPVGRPQSEVNACHWTRRLPADGEIDWAGSTVKQVVDLVRALDDPYPGAFIRVGGKTFIVRGARAYDRRMAGVAGRAVGRTEAGTLILALNGAVEILAIESEGIRSAGRALPVKYGDTLRR